MLKAIFILSLYDICILDYATRVAFVIKLIVKR